MQDKVTAMHFVLIDDDHLTNLINTKIITACQPFKVREFSSAQAALDWLLTVHENYPDVILLDLNMPDMDGWEFLDVYEKMPIARSHSRLYLLTSSISEDDIEMAKKYPSVKAYLRKPLTQGVLKEISDSSITNI